MYDVHAKTAPKSLLDKFAKINTKHHYNTQLSLELKKMTNSFTRTLNISNFRKKIKSLLLNVLGDKDNYLNVKYLIEYFMKLT